MVPQAGQIVSISARSGLEGPGVIRTRTERLEASIRGREAVCDTAPVAPLSRQLRRIEEPRMAAGGLTLAVVAMVAAYGYALTTSDWTAGGIAAAAGLIGIAGTGLLYAWRAVTGTSSE